MNAQPQTIVISDIHMSNGKGYSWFKQKDSDNLVAMLSSIANANGSDKNFSNVQELVILGDLFDLWLYPIHVKPRTVKQIIGDNKGVTQALSRCVGKLPKVYYMNGNHDMSVIPDDLRCFRSGCKEIICISTANYRKLHKEWHFEHGHAVDMFNSPDLSGCTIGGYPLGYFVARIAAGRPSTVWGCVRKILEEIFKDIISSLQKKRKPKKSDFLDYGSRLVEALIDVLSLEAGVDQDTLVRFSEPHLDRKYTVNDVKRHYGTLLLVWYKLCGYSRRRLKNTMLASRHLGGGLDWYAEELLSAPDPPKVVVMGHTHKPVQIPFNSGKYDNDGCFCEQKSFSYVEIVGNDPKMKYWPPRTSS